jgi:hypothetical protein
MVSSRLVELGQRAFDTVAAGVARGEPLVKCQLLASEFYEALKREMRQTPLAQRATLIAAAERCECGAIGPGAMLTELGNVLAMLQTPPPGGRPWPALWVIEGGLSASKAASATFSSSAARLARDAL